MAAPSVDSMAPEIAQRICEYLDHKSLCAFARASKQCNAVARVLLFQCIRIYFSESAAVTDLPQADLQSQIEHWTRVLERASSLRYVRWLEVHGQEYVHEIMAPTSYNVLGVNYATDELSLWDEEQEDGESLGEPGDNDRAWRSLADLIEQLPSLTDLIYSCGEQFPPCLLETLHLRRPWCRLHHRTFNLRGLNRRDTDPYEFALATSPSLYSISVRFTEMDRSDTEEYKEEAALRMISGLAPNLKDVRMFSLVGGGLIRTREPWQGFSLDTRKAEARPAKLTRLELRGERPLSQEKLEMWRQHVEFSSLRLLKIEGDIEEGALRWVAMQRPFSSLTALVLGMAHVWGRTRATDASFDAALVPFFRSLPPLEKLRIHGGLLPNTFDAIVQCHGKSLRRLCLDTNYELDQISFDAPWVRRLKHCTVLESLSLSPVPRSKGDAHEVAIYDALGTIPKLQRLSLTFDSSNPSTMQDPSFDEYHQQTFSNTGFPAEGHRRPRRGHVRDALINSALDETLARAIYDRISADRTSFPLECLELHSIGGADLGGDVAPAGLHEVVTNIGCSWRLVRSIRDDDHSVTAIWLNQPKVREAGVPGRSMHRDIEPIFRRIWPERRGNGWRDDWYSWPLAA